MAIIDAIILEDSVDISEDDSHSQGVFIGAAEIAAVHVPTIDNSKIDFEASVDGSTWRTVQDESLNKVEINAGTGDYVIELSTALVGGPYLRLAFGSAQTSDRTFYYVLKAH